MTISLELPHELEHELTGEAERLGLPLAEYALRVLSTGVRPGPGAESGPRTGVELVAFWQREELIGTRQGITDSSGHGRRLRRDAEQRVRHG